MPWAQPQHMLPESSKSKQCHSGHFPGAPVGAQYFLLTPSFPQLSQLFPSPGLSCVTPRRHEFPQTTLYLSLSFHIQVCPSPPAHCLGEEDKEVGSGSQLGTKPSASPAGVTLAPPSRTHLDTTCSTSLCTHPPIRRHSPRPA